MRCGLSSRLGNLVLLSQRKYRKSGKEQKQRDGAEANSARPRACWLYYMTERHCYVRNKGTYIEGSGTINDKHSIWGTPVQHVISHPYDTTISPIYPIYFDFPDVRRGVDINHASVLVRFLPVSFSSRSSCDLLTPNLNPPPESLVESSPGPPQECTIDSSS